MNFKRGSWVPILTLGRCMARRIIIASILLAILLGTPLAVCGAEQEYHVIQTGETLYSIAKSYSIPYEVLANINGITDPSKIRPGIVLLIPQVHVVGKGETYYGIAKKYDISIQSLKVANNLADSYVLRVGDVLIIPEQSNSSTAVAQSLPASSAPAQQSTSVTPPASAPSATLPTIQSSSAPAIATAPKSATPPAQPSGAQPIASEKPQAQPGASLPLVPTTVQPAPASSAQPGGPASLPVAQATAQPAPTSPPSAPGIAQPAAPTTTSSTSVPPPTKAAQSTEKTEGQNKSAARVTDALITWPVEGKGHYMSGKLEGIMFQTKRGASVQAVASGTVVSAGPSRGFGQVVFVQSKSGFVYVYGGNESLLVKTGDSIAPGKTIATVGVDSKDGNPTAYFFVFRNGQPVDPSLAPRE